MTDDRRKLELPDRRKHTFESLATRIDAHAAYLDNRLRGFFIKALAAFALIGVTSAVALLGFGYVLREIQKQRYELCVAQNQRHDNTEAKLRVEYANREREAKTEVEKKEIRRRRDVTFDLIDALAPVQNCAKNVRIVGGFEAPKSKQTPTPEPTP